MAAAPRPPADLRRLPTGAPSAAGPRRPHDDAHVVRSTRPGKRSGRGAYLCRRAECWNLGLRKEALARALKTRFRRPIARRWRRSRPSLVDGGGGVGPGRAGAEGRLIMSPRPYAKIRQQPPRPRPRWSRRPRRDASRCQQGGAATAVLRAEGAVRSSCPPIVSVGELAGLLACRRPRSSRR